MSARRVGVVPFVLMLMLSWREAPALATPAHAEPGSSTARFDPDSIKPAKGSARKAALDARAAGNYGEARSKALAGMAHAKGDEATYLRWIAGQASRSLGDVAGAASLLLPIAESDHPLASWATQSVAECLESRDPVHALALLDSLLAPSRAMRGWPGRSQAERARARVLDKLGRREDAILAFEKLAVDARDVTSGVQILLPLAELLKDGDEVARVRAYTLAQRVAQRVASESRAGKRADELARAMLQTLPSALQKELTKPRPEDKLLRADELASELRYEEAAQAYAAVEEAATDEPDLACRARYGRAKALLDRRARSEGAALMADVAERCTLDTDRRAWARYHAGRAFSSLGQNEQAIAQYEALEREASSHSLADDALFRAARVAKDMGDSAGMTERLELISLRYPAGDMHLRARFTLAWEAYQEHDLARAIEIVSAEPRDEPTEDLQGRSAYFRAKWLAEAGDLPSAIEAYVAAFNKAPISYFGQLAYTRLSHLAPERAKEESSRLSRARGVKLTFERRPELASVGFARVLALLSVGEAMLANWELRVLGFTSEGSDVELAMLSIALLDRADAPQLAIDLARRHMPNLLQRAPIGSDVAMYELVYPVAYASLIESTAKREGVPAAFVRAVAREESGFNPDAVSRAHAYGLVQLLVPTAKGLVKTKKERIGKHGKELLRPELNLTLGARFMASLAGSFRNHYALVPPAYNAGPGAVSRWLRERGTQSLDVWVENIPYDETRGYTRRVLQSYGIYNWLATSDMLSLPTGPLAGERLSSPDASTSLTNNVAR